jgi:N-acetylmuramoyl-L-alanine amidase
MHRKLAAAALVVAVALLSGCGAAARAADPAAGASDAAGAGVASGAVVPAGSQSSHASRTASPSPSPLPLPLAGRVVGIDPGHNGGNFSDPGYINQLIWNGRESETCDTTGTETASGFTEASFNFDVASDLRADLVAAGAKVVMTRQDNTSVGPCVTTRAQILNNAHADVAIDIHADGGPAWGRGFTVLEPVADGPNDAVISPSLQFGADVRTAMLSSTSMPESNYYGAAGLITRDDLAGLNLTTVPKVLIECGNMPNSTDAGLLASPAFQQQLARAFTAAIMVFLTGKAG